MRTKIFLLALFLSIVFISCYKPINREYKIKVIYTNGIIDTLTTTGQYDQPSIAIIDGVSVLYSESGILATNVKRFKIINQKIIK
jgi:hypothetical protein